jgi:amino acid adenylation domain-containing protein
VMHHIVSDGWSMGVFLRELVVLYEAFYKGHPSPLEELPIQYADFAMWQREWLEEEELETQLAYWEGQLAGVPVLELPTDRPRPAAPSHQGAQQSLLLPKEFSESLKALSRQEKVTLFMTLLAAFEVLLYRYTGQEDIAVGTPIANRTRTEIEELIGFFVNTLALRTDLSGDPTFRELVARVREVTLEAYAHQDLPFEKLVEELRPERNLSHPPLFQVGFGLQDAAGEGVAVGEVAVEPVEVDKGTAKFDLTLSMVEGAEGLRGTVEYSTDLFDAGTMARMLGHYRTLLEGIVANPNRRLSELPLLTEAERHRMLVEWNDTAVAYSEDSCIHELFEAQVARTPETVAVVFEGQQLTYRELNGRASQLARYLRALGVGPEVLVGICVERSLEIAVGILGILKAGGAYVPLDPMYPRERLAFMLDDTRTPVVLTQERLLERLPQHEAEAVCLDRDWNAIAQHDDATPPVEATAENLAYVIYTSGSTGAPKGVQIAHRGLCNEIESVIRTFRPQQGDRVLHSVSFSFDAATSHMLMTLCSGATLYVASEDSRLDSAGLAQMLREHGITHVSLPASVLAALPYEELPALETISVGAEACSAELVARWAPGRRFFNAYGPTEATIVATVVECTDGDRKPPIGRPIANTQVYILDHHMQPLPIGVPGELHIGGAGLARGYLNSPELTKEKFIPNPFSDESGARLYKTGDLARWLPDGNIEFLGRLDHQVKVRGFRIELGEIEGALRGYPAVQEDVVLAREDKPGDRRLVAYVVPDRESSLTVSKLRRFLWKKLPGYMVPSAFVFLDALPLTPNGKVDRRALPAPDATRPDLEEVFVAPRTPIEELVTGVWAEALELEQVGIHDNFFDLGGHSLLATSVVSQLRDLFRVELPLRSLFEAPTVAEVSQVIVTRETKPGQAEKIARILKKVEGMSAGDVRATLREKRKGRGNT